MKGRHFKVLRLLRTFAGSRTRNSWQPVIVGDIVPVPEGSPVKVRMRLPVTAAAFMVFWFGDLLCIAGMLLWNGLRRGSALTFAGRERSSVGAARGRSSSAQWCSSAT